MEKAKKASLLIPVSNKVLARENTKKTVILNKKLKNYELGFV